jgi:hypothetical protein
METTKSAPIDVSKLYTKSNYARKIQKTPTWVTQLIKQGKLIEVDINGKVMVMEVETSEVVTPQA